MPLSASARRRQRDGPGLVPGPHRRRRPASGCRANPRGRDSQTMKKPRETFIADQSGAMAVMAALLIVVLLSAAALGVDYGHMAWVQGELKKAAEAGALAGAKALAPYTGASPHPNWSQGQTAATQTVLLNRADAHLLTDCTISYGYWSLASKTLPLQSTAISPTARDVPAVRVQIAKSAGHNGGPLQMMFAPIFGVHTFDLSAQAVAMISFPGGMPVGAVFPPAAARRTFKTKLRPLK
jgi:Flp pilus assembly protein TadG